MLEKVKKLAAEKGMNISSLEKKAGIGNGTIGRWKESKPNLKTIEKVAEVLEIPVEELL